MNDRWRVLGLDDVPGFADEGRARWHMVRSSLGIEAFGVNAWTATADGQELIAEHDELGLGAGRHEELYVVLAGAARFVLDGEEVAAPAGTIVHVPDPGVRRAATGDEGTTVLAIGAARGEPFAVSSWERSAEALRFWATGEWERAIDVLQGQLVRDPGNPGVLYNLACAEARAGHDEDALDHLVEAVHREPRFRGHAQGDDDLATLRDNPRFPAPE
ncbi:MAG: TPR end-of-group domain-containing protein [Gaiella sp.]